MGFYLIEMNSGRLRGGADLYRQTFSRRGLEGLGPVRPAASAAAEAEATTSSSSAAVTSDNLFAAPSTVRIALVGQVNSGKSSLINILIGEDRTTVDTLPATRTVQRIEFEMGASGVTITLLDTPGYGESGASQMQLNEIQTALRTADAILLVMDAHSPARAADVQTLRDLKAWYRTHPQLKQAPVLGVLTHVDLLPPALQWEPPYDWRNPIEIKGERIAAAVQYASELFGQAVTAVVPVCTAAEPSRRWGIVDELLPELTLMLDDAHAASLLRAFEERLDKRPWAVLLQQLKRGSSELIQSWVRGQ
jgi:predicted GTPase